MTKIPKIIHYCWFGNGKKSDFINKCIQSWRKFFPDYEIKEWNESNFNIKSNEYAYQAYEEKKYAFVSDFVRLKVLYEYGGIYFDTDIEVIKDFSDLIEEKDIFCFEMENQIMTGVMIAKKGSDIIWNFLKHYENLKFKLDDGTLNLEPNTIFFTNLLKERGLICNNKFQTINNDISIFPNEYFCAYDMKNSCFSINSNTYAVHHYKGTWMPKKTQLSRKLKRILAKILGKNLYEKMRNLKNLKIRRKK